MRPFRASAEGVGEPQWEGMQLVHRGYFRRKPEGALRGLNGCAFGNANTRAEKQISG